MRRVLLLWLTSGVLAFAGSGCDRAGPASPSAGELAEQLHSALREPSALGRYGGLARSLEGLDRDNLPGLIDALESELVTLGEGELRMLVGEWARLDAPGAFQRVMSWPRRPLRRTALGEIVYTWCRQDLPAAHAAVETLPTELTPAREEVVRKLVEGWLQTPDVAGATQYVAALPQGSFRQTLTTLIVLERLEQGGAKAVMGWADDISLDAPERFKLESFRKAARVVAQRDPAAAVEWLARHEGAPYTDGAARLIATNWVDSEPEAAMAWLLSRPAGDERDKALRFAFGSWVAEDASAAKKWLETHLGEPGVDPAAEALARRIVQSEPREAIAWAQRIEDPARRTLVLQEIGADWFALDPGAAEAWLAKAELSEELGQSIREGPKRPKRRLPSVR